MRREAGWPSPRRGADKSARPPRRPAPPPPRAPQYPGQGPGPCAGMHPRPPAATWAAGTQLERHGVSARLAPGRDAVGRAPGASPEPRSSGGGGCSLVPGPRSPESLPGATSAHSPRGRPGSDALCRQLPLVLGPGPGPEPEPEPGGMDAGGGARAPATSALRGGPSPGAPCLAGARAGDAHAGRAASARSGWLSGRAGPLAPSGAARAGQGGGGGGRTAGGRAGGGESAGGRGGGGARTGPTNPAPRRGSARAGP